jgi:DNA-binding transcriptional regulator LsrR (DeoR family)
VCAGATDSALTDTQSEEDTMATKTTTNQPAEAKPKSAQAKKLDAQVADLRKQVREQEAQLLTDAAVTLHDEGKTPAQIAKAIGKSEARTKTLLRKAGKLGTTRANTTERNEKIREALEAGETVESIAEAHGLKVSRVRRIRSKLGLGTQRHTVTWKDAAQRKQAEAAVAKLSAIGSDLGVSAAAVLRRVVKDAAAEQQTS